MSADEKTRWTVAAIFAVTTAALSCLWFALSRFWHRMADKTGLALAFPLIFVLAVLSPVVIKVWRGR